MLWLSFYLLEVVMTIWLQWWSLVRLLRPAFSRERSFLWFATSLVAMSIRPDLAGVTSFVRALGLSPRFYTCLIDNFHSKAIKLDKLAVQWTAVVLKIFPGIVRVNGRLVFVGDGIKAAKEGRKMPGVKSLHQESTSNSKPTFIMGHSCQAIALLVGLSGYFFAVPLISRIHEGLVFSNRDRRTLLDKLLGMLSSLMVPASAYVVLDAYYGARKIVLGLLEQGHHLICRAKSNAVAYFPAIPKATKGRGKPKVYGTKVGLISLFATATFMAASSPVYGEDGVEILYYTIDLLWRPVGRLVRFVFVKHPTRGKIIFMSTDLTLAALEIIKIYGLRFKIEVSFKQAVHTLGTYAYHFWMKNMAPIKRCSGDQYLHHRSKEYREAVVRKMRAYNVHIQLGIIAQGLMQYLSLQFSKAVWGSFGSWIRTIRPGVLPSEQIVTAAMRSTAEDFLQAKGESNVLANFIAKRRNVVKKVISAAATS
jgi:hypothetical protein